MANSPSFFPQDTVKRELLIHSQQLRSYVQEWSLRHENLINRELVDDLEATVRISHGSTAFSATTATIGGPERTTSYAVRSDLLNARFQDGERSSQTKDCGNVSPSRLDNSPATSQRLQRSRPELPDAIRSKEKKASAAASAQSSMSPSHGMSCNSSEMSAATSTTGETMGRRAAEMKHRTPLHRFVCSHRFTYLCAVVILANAIVIGYSAEYAIKNPQNPEDITLDAFEIAFTMFYMMELGLKICVYGRGFFYGREWRWNLFDALLILQSLYDHLDNVFHNLSGTVNVSNYSFLRMMRLAKMLKLVRVIRLLRSFRELRLLLSCLLGCVKSSTWAMVLVSVLSYMFGIGILQACSSYMVDGSEISDRDREDVERYWGSVLKAMLTLYQATMGGEDWVRFARPFESMGGLVYGLFLCYIAIFDFVVVNTISSIFVEAMMNNSAHDQQLVIEEMMERKEEYIAKLSKLYAEMDDDNDGKITYKEFSNHVNRPEMRAFVASLDIDAYDARQFFRILSGDKEKPVDLDTFVEGCIRLKGVARSMDLMDLHYVCKNSFAELHEVHKENSRYFGLLVDVHQMLIGNGSLLPSGNNLQPGLGEVKDDAFANCDLLDMEDVSDVEVSRERSDAHRVRHTFVKL